MRLMTMPVAQDKRRFTRFNAERMRVDHRILGDRPVGTIYDELHFRHGYLIMDDDENNVQGIFSMIPYSEIGYPAPAFPTHWRPQSSLFHAGVLAYRGRYGALAILRAILEGSDFGAMRRPITVTAELATEAGKRFFMDICGATPIKENAGHPVAAITFTRRLDVYNLARERIRRAATRRGLECA